MEIPSECVRTSQLDGSSLRRVIPKRIVLKSAAQSPIHPAIKTPAMDFSSQDAYTECALTTAIDIMINVPIDTVIGECRY